MKKAQIIFTIDRGDKLSIQMAGDMTYQELNWALDQLKLKILTGQAPGQNAMPVIPGMLTPDLRRLPGDVQRRMIANG